MHRLIRVGVLASVIGVAGIASGPAEARDPGRTMLTLSAPTAPVTAGAKTTVAFRAPTSARCSLDATSGRYVSHAATFRARKAVLDYQWSVPKQARSGQWTLRLRCRRAGRHVAVTRAIVTITGTGQGRVLPRHLRPHQSRLVGAGGSSSQPAWAPFGTVLVAGKDWFGGTGVDVMSNGGWGCVDGCNLWSGYGPEWQCVELVDRFLVTKGWSPEVWADAYAFYDRAPADSFDKHPNGDGYTPVPGDVIVWKGGNQGLGHVAVVDSVSGNQVNWVEEDDSPSGRASGTIDARGALGKYNTLTPIGYLHAKANTPTPPQSIQGSSPNIQGSSPDLQGSNQPVQGTGDNSGGGSPPAQTTPQAQPTGFVIEDDVYGGTWARTDPNDGTWYGHDHQPANSKYWFANGLGVGVDCARSGAAYSVVINGQHQTWSWWAHVTDDTWVPVVVFSTVWSDGNPGVAGCS
jgi:hypothetical protein